MPENENETGASAAVTDPDDPYLPWTVAFKVFAPGPEEALNAARLGPGAPYINAGYYIVAGHDDAARTSADRGGDTLAVGKLPPVPAEPFVEFVKDANGEPVWINPRHVASVAAGTAVGTTWLEIVGSETRAVVKGTARGVAAKLARRGREGGA